MGTGLLFLMMLTPLLLTQLLAYFKSKIHQSFFMILQHSSLKKQIAFKTISLLLIFLGLLLQITMYKLHCFRKVECKLFVDTLARALMFLTLSFLIALTTMQFFLANMFRLIASKRSFM